MATLEEARRCAQRSKWMRLDYFHSRLLFAERQMYAHPPHFSEKTCSFISIFAINSSLVVVSPLTSLLGPGDCSLNCFHRIRIWTQSPVTPRIIQPVLVEVLFSWRFRRGRDLYLSRFPSSPECKYRRHPPGSQTREFSSEIASP